GQWLVPGSTMPFRRMTPQHLRQIPRFGEPFFAQTSHYFCTALPNHWATGLHMQHVMPSLDTVFCEAIEIPDPTDPASHFSRVCGTDMAFRRRVQKLIEAHFRADESFLKQQTDVLAEALPLLSLGEKESPGTFVGAYKLLEVIGEGGMGVVFMAEQAEPVRRK